ncbi:MAG: hypothetical protein ACM3UV_07965, partial [Nocardioidaceae bacterium]
NDNSATDARASVSRFFAAFESRDGAGACEELTEGAAAELEKGSGEPCDRAVLELELAPSRVAAVSVATVDAKADLVGGGAAFLEETSTGWRISAIGCEARPGQPYDCQLAA